MTYLYSLVAPRDVITFRAASREVAALALLLGFHGKYGADAVDHDAGDVPIFMIGGAQGWWKDTFTAPISDSFETHYLDVTACFESFISGTAEDRARFETEQAALSTAKDRLAHRKTWETTHSTSTNGISTHAWQIAENLLSDKP